jgi:hypothetical protein
MFAFTMRFPEHDREPFRHGSCFTKRFGGHSGGETPGPIPNPEVKPTSADGTAPGTVWESRTPPDINHKKGRLLGRSFFIVTAQWKP